MKLWPPGEVCERRQSVADHVRAVGRKLERCSRRFVEPGGGVDVRPEARAEPFEVGNQFAGLEVLCAVEGHVFEKVGHPLLVVGFVQRPRSDGEAERHALLGERIVTHEVTHAVRQCAGAHGGVERNDVLRIERWRRRPRALEPGQATP